MLIASNNSWDIMGHIKIFYADDDEDDLMFFNEAVEQISEAIHSPISLDIFKDGENLIEGIKNNEEHNSVLFLDINMPLKSGFQFLEEIRNDPKLEDFPVVMYSTSSDHSIIERCKKLGASYYAIKPYDFNDLIKLITSFADINWENHIIDCKNFLYK